MKKYLKCVAFAMIGLFGIAMASCSKDDPVTNPEEKQDEQNSNTGSSNPNVGSNNTTDMAVTGGVTYMNTGVVTIKGYINVDQTSLLLVEDFGIEYSTDAEFGSFSTKSEQVSGYTGREFSITLHAVKPNTTYYYRTYIHQISGMYQYGETLSFKTKNVSFTVSDIAYTQATIKSSESYLGSGMMNGTYYLRSTLYYSTKTDGPFSKYSIEFDQWGEYTITDLEPNTTYYCYLVASGGYTSDTFSFTTKALPFNRSEISVSCKYTPAYKSYYDRYYKRTVDLTWLGGTYKVDITSSAGSQYKYGILGVKCNSIDEFKQYRKSPDENALIYSTSTGSPYTITATSSAGSEWWAYDYIERIDVLLELVKSGDASDDDYFELAQMLDDLRYDSKTVYPYIQAFIEIDGEKIYVGSIYHME